MVKESQGSVLGFKYFFQIPIYRCDPEKFHKELEKTKEDLIKEYVVISEGKISDEFKMLVRYRLDETLGPWQYRQVIGWIQLYVFGNQIRGDTWFVKAKRIRRENKKKIFYLGKAFEMHFSREDTSLQIFTKLCSQIKRLYRKKLFKNRHLDLEMFNNIGPFIDWRKFIGFKN